ncbi:prepilin-type N-terminal cleavage/methylation domain-containing protein [Lentisphaera profundi]|uniref:Prepilin-type N-terminal cleavage/methylation domain-containing protein n=1 Tax=Lentisphaera profundi TaxID=1658616 RepID=A0ABY7W096_9BACT|nr:prepilin-type N-terminal cleavage/methylation domain-containing protein [Lentisphaera profundi]WDE99382.1 prepilin-type N-terminal cleavage/methylation domain-containing protein [Lentisphaera profundi]
MKKFTLIEVLVVVAIIGILASLLLPSLKNSRKSAQSASCKNNLKQMTLAFYSYADDNNDHIPYATWKWSWQDFIYDYLSNNTLSDAEKAANTWPSDKALDVFVCPGARHDLIGDNGFALSNYIMPAANSRSNSSRVSNWYHPSANPETESRSLSFYPKPSELIHLSEYDGESEGWRYQGFWNTVIKPDHQGDPRGNGFHQNDSINYTLDLHVKDKVNFLFVDGHVGTYHPYSPDVIGEGVDPSSHSTGGFWTYDPND